MKRLIINLFCFLPFCGMANHITGGEMYYTFLGFQNDLYYYEVTMKLYQRCESGRSFPNPTIVSLFDKTNNARVNDIYVSISNTENISISEPDPCISNPPWVCYDVAYYTFNISVPASQGGYVIASEINYRINGINNLLYMGNIGATYTAEIPGLQSGANSPTNNSARFTGSDLVIVCAENEFSYSFAATDPDTGDQLLYSFCEAYASTTLAGGNPQPAGPPPFTSVPYNSPEFSSSGPLGLNVLIDPQTGLLTGTAPYSGIYVVTVCVNEIRAGQLIARQRKDIQINVADCNIAAALLYPEYSLCKDSYTISISNRSNSPLIQTTFWEFYDESNNLLHTTSNASATYTFPSIGNYSVKLVINRNGNCADSATAVIRVFPGFVPDFTITGLCSTQPTLFTDASASVYGTPDSWSWDFGELSSILDISSLQNPSYQYPSQGNKTVRLIVTDTRSCRDTVFKNITITDKPPLLLAFKDTLICNGDQLMLHAQSSGIFSWSPPVNIINPNTATPTVSPSASITYYVDLDDNGCINRDSVRVNVVDFVTLQPMNDTIICRGDTIQLRIISDGLHYSWTPANQVIDPLLQNPLVVTNTAQTDYEVTAVIGGCSALADIRVTTVPYPVANAGADFSLCYNTQGRLNGSTDGSSWLWSPAAFTNNPSSLNTVAHPTQTTDFILTAWDTQGCPKPGRDTVTVTVFPKMNVYAGNDTAVVVNQPLQLLATGAAAYQWLPFDFLSSAHVDNPVAVFDNRTEAAIRYKVIGTSTDGCKDSAFINIKIFYTGPEVFVPTAFTPNNDGRNDMLRPIGAGISHIEAFSIYNRWGQLVFTTTVNGKGWDGMLNGTPQTTGVYVWFVKATDFTGRAYFKRGTVTLIR